MAQGLSRKRFIRQALGLQESQDRIAKQGAKESPDARDLASLA